MRKRDTIPGVIVVVAVYGVLFVGAFFAGRALLRAVGVI